MRISKRLNHHQVKHILCGHVIIFWRNSTQMLLQHVGIDVDSGIFKLQNDNCGKKFSSAIQYLLEKNMKKMILLASILAFSAAAYAEDDKTWLRRQAMSLAEP